MMVRVEAVRPREYPAACSVTTGMRAVSSMRRPSITHAVSVEVSTVITALGLMIGRATDLRAVIFVRQVVIGVLLVVVHAISMLCTVVLFRRRHCTVCNGVISVIHSMCVVMIPHSDRIHAVVPGVEVRRHLHFQSFRLF